MQPAGTVIAGLELEETRLKASTLKEVLRDVVDANVSLFNVLETLFRHFRSGLANAQGQLGFGVLDKLLPIVNDHDLR